jgi:hypothetical protein
MAKLIIGSPLALIGQNIIGLFGFLEFFFTGVKDPLTRAKYSV